MTDVWLNDSALHSLGPDAWVLANRLLKITNAEGRIQVDKDNVAHSVRCSAFQPRKWFHEWPQSRIAKLLETLRSAGVLVLLVHGDRAWLGFHERFLYRKGSDSSAGPPPTAQTDLPLQGELSILQKDYPIPIRVEVEKDKTRDPSPVRASEAAGANDAQSSSEPNEEEWLAECTRYQIPHWYALKRYHDFNSVGWLRGKTLRSWRKTVPLVKQDYENDGRPNEPKKQPTRKPYDRFEQIRDVHGTKSAKWGF